MTNVSTVALSEEQVHYGLKTPIRSNPGDSDPSDQLLLLAPPQQ